MAVTAVDILETIRDNASNEYIDRIPEATVDSLAQVGKALTSNKNLMNEFIDTLINKIALTHVMSKMFNNPLAILKGQGVPYGSTIEELFVNPATDTGFQKDGTYLLKTTRPDGKSAYYGLNRQSTYPVSITEDQLKLAFKDEQSFMGFYNSIVSSLYSGDNIDEFTLIKKMLGLALDNSAMQVVESDITQPKELSKSISNMSKMYAFPTTQFCGYNLVNAEAIAADDKAKECITFCPSENQALIIRADVQTEIDYEVLATMFHLEVAKLEAMTILVDDIPSTKYDVYAMLVDRESIQIRDSVYKIESQYLGNCLTWQLWLHHWQFIYLSMFGNAVAFGKAKG